MKIVTDFNNTYCVASKLHYEEILKKFGLIYTCKIDIVNFYEILENENKSLKGCAVSEVQLNSKQIEYNEYINSWLYVEEKEDGNNRNNSIPNNDNRFCDMDSNTDILRADNMAGLDYIQAPNNIGYRECNKCKEVLSKDEFSIDKKKDDGLSIYCKECSNKMTLKAQRTKKGLVNTIYATQKHNSKRRKHNPPSYTKQELREWLYSQELFHRLYDTWRRLGFESAHRPSVDRIDNSVGYTMSNIQLMTWKENCDKSHKDTISGDLNRRLRPISQYNPDGSYIMTFHSVSQAIRHLGKGSESNIVKCCKGIQETSYGYIWR